MLYDLGYVWVHFVAPVDSYSKLIGWVIEENYMQQQEVIWFSL